jgi:hypothetical protein
LLAGILGVTTAMAQKAVIPAGGDASGSGGRASYSVGQIAYTTATGSNGTSTQGVQQPYEFFIVGIDKNPGINLQMSVYPNPTPAKIVLNIGDLEVKNLSFMLFEMSGKLITKQPLRDNLTEIPMETLAQGSYLLKVMKESSEMRTFKIIKK